jgi:predicted nuclease with TOPRIM domain
VHVLVCVSFWKGVELDVVDQVEALGREKSSMQTERTSLQKQVGSLTDSVRKLSNEKVRLEQELESEEELIVNRMQRQFDDLMVNYKVLEKTLKVGFDVSKDRITAAPVDIVPAFYVSQNCSSQLVFLSYTVRRQTESLFPSQSCSQCPTWW